MKFKENNVTVKAKKNVALVAHDKRKEILLDWVRYNKDVLIEHTLYCTGTTGSLLSKEGLHINCLMSGPLGGDAQLGAMISEGKIDILIFFPDPLTSAPHDSDVKGLIRLAQVWNIPIACNRSTADFLISSHLWHDDYIRKVIDYTDHTTRFDK